MPLFRTPVVLPPQSVSISPKTSLLFVGSCFAEEVGKRAKTYGLQATSNPTGTLYNPESILLTLQRWQHNAYTSADDLFKGSDELWHSRFHNSLADARTKEECLERCLTADKQGIKAFREAAVILITWGTNRLYVDNETKQVLANCHKQPPQFYCEQTQTTQEIARHWISYLQCLPAEKKVVFTVSPYRYKKYGLHGNQLAKSALLLAIDEICNALPKRCAYFPAYEIVLDELRDYRFYAQDMLHVSPVAADYVWEQFQSWALTPEALSYSAKWKKIAQRLQHVPRDAQSEAYKHFQEETKRLIETTKND